MPRKKKLESTIAEVLDANPSLKTAAELSPPEREIVEPDPNRPRGFADKVRPSGPRRRDPSEPANIFASDNLRVDRDGHMYQVTSRKELTGDQKDFIARQGFTPVDDEERIANGSQREINRAGGDVNAIGFVVGKGGGRGR